MKKFLLSLFMLLAFAQVVGAEERVVPLKRGTTLWGILGDEGCSPKQRVPLWPQVARDSGLNPADHMTWLADITLIVLKRNCNGQLREETQSGKVASLQKQLQDAEKEADRRVREARAKAEKERQRELLVLYSVISVLGLLSVIMAMFLIPAVLRARRKTQEAMEAGDATRRCQEEIARLQAQEVVSPQMIVREEGSVRLEFTRVSIGGLFECSGCGKQIPVFEDADVTKHVKGSDHPLSRVREVVDPRLHLDATSEVKGNRTRRVQKEK